jgi:hypothetical protein
VSRGPGGGRVEAGGHDMSPVLLLSFSTHRDSSGIGYCNEHTLNKGRREGGAVAITVYNKQGGFMCMSLSLPITFPFSLYSLPPNTREPNLFNCLYTANA